MQNRKSPVRLIARYIPVPFLEAGVLIVLAMIAQYYD